MFFFFFGGVLGCWGLFQFFLVFGWFPSDLESFLALEQVKSWWESSLFASSFLNLSHIRMVRGMLFVISGVKQHFVEGTVKNRQVTLASQRSLMMYGLLHWKKSFFLKGFC